MPVVSERVVWAYERAYGDVERRVGHRPAEASRWVEWMRASAAMTRTDLALKRYVLLRTFVLARDAGEPMQTLDAIAGEVEPLLADGTPAALVQRAELRAALAVRTPGFGRPAFDRSEFAGRHEAAVTAYTAVLEWQVEHGVLDAVPTTLRLARPHLRHCDSTDVLAAFGAIRERARQAFERAFAASPPGAPGARRIAILIDASGSMLNSRPNDVGRRVLGHVAEADWFTVAVFREGDVNPYAEMWLPLRGEVRMQALAFVDRLSPYGSTEVLPALAFADDIKADRICLISDGEVPDGDAVRNYLRARGKGAPVDTVATESNNEAGVALMKEIARMTGGVFRTADDPDAGRLE